MARASPQQALELIDWRRRVAELYAAVRGLPPEEGWRRWCEERRRLFLEHPQSPLPAGARDQAHAPRYFPYDPAWRTEAWLEPGAADQTTALPGSGGSGFDVASLGVARFTLGGTERRLSVHWLNDYAGGILVVFRDATSGDETYGAGRYLLDTAKGADLGTAGDRLVFDFNFAYQPSCSYDARWSCPLAPPENRLALPLRAGERLAVAPSTSRGMVQAY